MKKPKVFKLISDMFYYDGGYPSENSEPKLDVLIRNFAKLYKYFKLIENNDIDEKLKKYKINISIDENEFKNEEFTNKNEKYSEFIELWKEIDPSKTDILNKKFIINTLLDRAHEKQQTICQLADTIKIDDANIIKEKCEIVKPAYIKAVNLKYKKMLEKPLDKDIENIEKNVESIQEVIKNI